MSLTENVEMIRDGGSFAATFSETSGKRYILFFEIRRSAEGGFLFPKQHLPPVLIDCDASKRPVSTERVTYSELSGPQTPVSWKDARKLLGEIADNKPSENTPRRSIFFEKWLQEMVGIAQREGAAST